MENDARKQQAIAAAQTGLDWIVRNQCIRYDDANKGRFPDSYHCAFERVDAYTTNWTCGVATEALLVGYLHFDNPEYLNTARRAVDYIKSLQELSEHASDRVRGVIREETPQTTWAHPRDALTAAWAMLDFGIIADDNDAINRAKAYADWYMNVALENGYPYWTVRLDDDPWDPPYCGSFHSGSAFFFHRLLHVTGDKKYLQPMRTILDFYNEHHTDSDGSIHVIVDRDTFNILDGTNEQPEWWQIMHRYNDDFGALANLAVWRDTGEEKYLNAARKFCEHMARSQNKNGGFGPGEFTVTSAGGSVLIELQAAKVLGLDWIDDTVADRAADYVMSLQHKAPNRASDGAFIGFSGDYHLRGETATMRTTAYSILGLLRYAGARDRCYFFRDDTSRREHGVREKMRFSRSAF